MPLSLKHTSNVRTPDLKNVNDVGTRNSLEQIMRLVYDLSKDIYDDLVRAATDRTGALPTAGKDYLGRFMLKTNSSAEDTLHICVFDDNSTSYLWKEVTLS